MAIWTTTHEIPNLCPQLARTPGLHLTDVLVYLQNINRVVCGLPPNEPYIHNLRTESGNEFEWAYNERLKLEHPDEYTQPGELMVDIGSGIPMYLTPDFIWLCDTSLPTGSKRVLDTKWTTKSLTNWDPTTETDKTWYIRSQLMCYCKVINTLHGGFVIRYARGNYSDIQLCQIRYNVTFTQYELDNIWCEVLAGAQMMQMDNKKET